MKTVKIGKNHFSFFDFSKSQVNGGMLLMGIVLLAMIIANSPWGGEYTSFWTQKVYLQIGDFNVFNHHGHPMTLMGFINDVLMSIFFFSVGLEIKREVMVGELCSLQKALLPIIAACGGMIVPVLIYYSMTMGTEAESGLAIPMATDIAFSLGVLSLFGKRVPISLKVFLTAFAVVDDIGGILVIALFYSSHLDASYLLYAAGVLFVLLAGNRRNIYNRWFYISVGLVLWYCFLQSGIHATIAGVIVAATVPAVPHDETGKYINSIKESIEQFPVVGKEGIVLTNVQINVLKNIESASDRVISPLQSLEDSIHGLVNYFVLPIFAFANAGVVLNVVKEGSVDISTLTAAIAIGLIAGKFIGIYLFTWLAVKLRISSLSNGMTWKNLLGISLLGGIGFTVSLFIANLSFGDNIEMLDQAKLGVLIGTFIAGILGYITLHFTLPKE